MNASRHGPKISGAEAAVIEAARGRMVARHRLIEGMIRNNELQLKNESARGGAEIERECARRDASASGAGPDAAAELAAVSRRLEALNDEHRRLVSEREFLNSSLLEFESGASHEEHSRAGHS